jgi:hypothetical protein
MSWHYSPLLYSFPSPFLLLPSPLLHTILPLLLPSPVGGMELYGTLTEEEGLDE